MPPRAMLLLLALALLGTPTCWAGSMYGWGGGKYFSTSPDDENEISAIRVCIGPIGLFKSVQVKFGSYWSEKHGTIGGKCQEFVLWPNEHVTMVFGTYGLFLQSLVLYTDFGRLATFGKDVGNSFYVYPDEDGQVLTGVFGEYRLLGISGIGFTWKFPLVEATAPPETTTKAITS